MATPFSRTLRSLQGESSSGWIFGLSILAVLLATWLLWFVAAELPVFAVSDEARLEVEAAVHPVAAHTSGRLVEVSAVVGGEVNAGDVLFELDAALERRRLDEEIARREALEKELESLRVALATEAAGLTDAGQAAGSAIDEARSRFRAAIAAAELAEEEAARTRRLHSEGLTSEMEGRRADAVARERRADAEALEQATIRLRNERQLERSDRQARLDLIEREIAELEGAAATSAAAARRLQEEIGRRVIRAPASGRLGEVAKVRPGSVVAAGDHLATVIPAVGLKVVASFTPSDALALVRGGQTAQLRLDGFPWTEFGSLPVTVSRVAAEAREGRLWVDGAVRPSPDSAIPLQHGMPGVLVVEIERLAPAELVLRAAGRAVTAKSASRQRDGG